MELDARMVGRVEMIDRQTAQEMEIREHVQRVNEHAQTEKEWLNKTRNFHVFCDELAEAVRVVTGRNVGYSKSKHTRTCTFISGDWSATLTELEYYAGPHTVAAQRQILRDVCDRLGAPQ